MSVAVPTTATSAPAQARCIACGATSETSAAYARIMRFGTPYAVMICSACGQARTDPFPTAEDYAQFYSNDTYRADGVRFVGPMERLLRSFRQGRLRRIRRFVPRGKMLDIGCGGGQFLADLRVAGWETVGVEVNEAMAAHARQAFGLDVRIGRLDQAGFADATFDVVTMYHVLEHIPDPVAALRECHRILRPGGLLVVAVPNFASWQSRTTGKHWFHLDIPHHLHHFTTNALMHVTTAQSFQVRHTTHFSIEQNPYGWLQSLLNQWRLGHNLFYDFLKTKRLRAKFSWKLIPTVLLLPVLAPTALLLSIVEAACKAGGTIEVLAVKSEG